MKTNNIQLVVLGLLISFLGGFVLNKGIDVYYGKDINVPKVELPSFFDIEGMHTFKSETEFREYLKEAGTTLVGFGGGIAMPGVMMAEDATLLVRKESSNRISDTNVQVKGIDEPDIVKTDGKDIYFSQENRYYGFTERMIAPSYKTETKIISVDDLELKDKIEKSGNLLLDNGTLIIFSGNEITGYDTESLREEWEIELDNSFIQTSRLYNNTIYLVVRQNINSHSPCPIRPMKGVIISCSNIYYPIVPTPVDVTYTIFQIDTKTGDIKEEISFVGSQQGTVIYMSENNLFVTYTYDADFIEFSYNFYNKEAHDLISDLSFSRIEKLMTYDISPQSKQTELNIIIQDYYNSLSNDERMRVQNEVTNRMSDYYKENKRELEKVGIVKIDLNSLKVLAVGEVPGRLLNQFSLDEYDNHLRVAVTVGGNNWRFGVSGESSNDVYVLNESLKIVGEEKDLGVGERIYSVRFIADKGYVVTFRETDPFYVLDLSIPSQPKVKGELKIPGYSSYLHPVSDDLILGIGKEGSKVKLSLFDVSNPSSPKEKAKYTLDEYWSEALNNHHAFLMDKKHQVFFLPGSKGAYIFSYENDKLSLKRTLSGVRAKRALYINDYLYIISDNEITVLDENNWEEVNNLDL